MVARVAPDRVRLRGPPGRVRRAVLVAQRGVQIRVLPAPDAQVVFKVRPQALQVGEQAAGVDHAAPRPAMGAGMAITVATAARPRQRSGSVLTLWLHASTLVRNLTPDVQVLSFDDRIRGNTAAPIYD